MSESKWKPIQWGNCCAEAEVLTTLTEPNVAYDGDEARCLGCGRPGVVSADDDEAHINWHDETDCKCWWCQQADEIDKSHATIADLRRQVESKTVWAGHDPFTGEQVLTLLNENSDLRKQLAEARRVIKAAKYVARELEGEYFEPNGITQLRAALAAQEPRT